MKIFWCQFYDSQSSGISQSETWCNTASTSSLESFPAEGWRSGSRIRRQARSSAAHFMGRFHEPTYTPTYGPVLYVNSSRKSCPQVPPCSFKSGVQICTECIHRKSELQEVWWSVEMKKMWKILLVRILNEFFLQHCYHHGLHSARVPWLDEPNKVRYLNRLGGFFTTSWFLPHQLINCLSK